MEIKVGWYDIPDVTGKLLSATEIEALLQMTESQGWKAYLKIKEFDATEAAKEALDPFGVPDRQAMCRRIHACAVSDMQLQERLLRALQTKQPKEHIGPPPDGVSVIGCLAPSISDKVKNHLTENVG